MLFCTGSWIKMIQWLKRRQSRDLVSSTIIKVSTHLAHSNWRDRRLLRRRPIEMSQSNGQLPTRSRLEESLSPAKELGELEIDSSRTTSDLGLATMNTSSIPAAEARLEAHFSLRISFRKSPIKEGLRIMTGRFIQPWKQSECIEHYCSFPTPL